MATLFSTLALYFSFTLLCFHLIAASFSPIDYYLINCGSHEPKTVDSDHRYFTGDSTMSFLASTGTISLTDASPSPKSSPIYHTARVFTRPSKYKFLIKNPGTHLLRLHFRRLISSSLDFNNAKFHVLANGFVLFNSLSIEMGQDFEIVKDYVIGVDSDVLVISFVPIDNSKFAFVNGIDVMNEIGQKTKVKGLFEILENFVWDPGKGRTVEILKGRIRCCKRDIRIMLKLRLKTVLLISSSESVPHPFL